MIRTYLLLSLSLLPLFAGDADAPAPTFAVDAVARSPRNVLSNQGIVLLSEAGYDEDFLIDLIIHKQTHFDTTVEGLAFLASHGISERIVRFMVANESKSAGLNSAVAPPPTLSAGVGQKVRVPDPQKAFQPVGDHANQVFSGSDTEPAYHYAPFRTPSYTPLGVAPPAAAPYLVSERHFLFWKRWYIVNPAPAAWPHLQSQFQPTAYQRANHFPVW